ncbi:uncharacterized protein LOC119177395 isoform X1 [Rhipicephalus microplus]|uniref:uncharacterized protein LOC119177395 isoform X1 n=1 Tax=Rhipicephalus microplus TaxID=6941 RepID=UPI003F6D7177
MECVHGTESGAAFYPWPWRRSWRDLANERAQHPSHVEAARLSGALFGGGGAVTPASSHQTSMPLQKAICVKASNRARLTRSTPRHHQAAAPVCHATHHELPQPASPLKLSAPSSLASLPQCVGTSLVLGCNHAHLSAPSSLASLTQCVATSLVLGATTCSGGPHWRIPTSRPAALLVGHLVTKRIHPVPIKKALRHVTSSRPMCQRSLSSLRAPSQSARPVSLAAASFVAPIVTSSATAAGETSLAQMTQVPTSLEQASTCWSTVCLGGNRLARASAQHLRTLGSERRDRKIKATLPRRSPRFNKSNLRCGDFSTVIVN